MGSRAISNQRHRVLKNSAGICLRTLPMISRPRIAVRKPSRCVGAADVEPMHDMDGKCDKPAFVKDRTNDCEITGMGAVAKRVVRYNHITGKNRRAEPVDNASDLRTERSSQERYPAGLGDKLALRIEGSIVSKTKVHHFREWNPVDRASFVLLTGVIARF